MIYNCVKILDIPFSCCSFFEILQRMEEAIKKKEKGNYISITNTESAFHATRIKSHLNYIQNSAFSCCDGIGVVLAGKIFGHNIPRLNGPDLMLKCCEYGVTKNWRHYFYGGKKEIPALLSKNLIHRYPKLVIAGSFSPPFRDLTSQEKNKILKEINDSDADIIWVGLGLLKQENWISENINKISASWMIGVGAAFDFHAGTIKRAPRFYRTMGIEWLYRLIFEPRMFIRNLYSFYLLLLAIKEKLYLKN